MELEANVTGSSELVETSGVERPLVSSLVVGGVIVLLASRMDANRFVAFNPLLGVALADR